MPTRAYIPKTMDLGYSHSHTFDWLCIVRVDTEEGHKAFRRSQITNTKPELELVNKGT